MKYGIGITLLTVLSLGCTSDDQDQPALKVPEPDKVWQTASLADVMMDVQQMQELITRIRSGRIANLHSLLIVKDQKLVVEEYFNGSHPDDIHTQQSITKSVLSLLCGIAFETGSVQLNGSVLEFFAPHYPAIQLIDDHKRTMSWGNLLTMKTGMAWKEDPYEGSPLQTLNQSRGDWVKFVLDQPMERAPGELFRYNSGAAILLGGMIRQEGHNSVQSYSREKLFSKIGIDTARWYRSPYDGLPHTGGGLLLRARDMAKIGQLILNNGRWQQEQIVSENWIRSIKERVTPTRRGYYNAWYSYLWWILPYEKNNRSSLKEDDIITASGAGGQWIFIVPKHQLVVVVTAATQNGEEELAPVEFLYSSILPAVN